MPELTVISLGWGVQSTTLAFMSALGDLPPVDAIIHADTTHEREMTYAYAHKWTPRLEALGARVITVTDRATGAVSDAGDKNILIPAYTLAIRGARIVSGIPRRYCRGCGALEGTAHYEDCPNIEEEEYDTAGGLESVVQTEGQLRRQCTQRWKIAPLRQAVRKLLEERGLKDTPGVVEQWIGISQDEFHRMRTSDVRYITHRYPLIERKMTRAACIAYLEANSIEVPGKSACVFCPYHNASAWQELKRHGGQDWRHALEIDNIIRDRRPPFPLFVHPKRIPLNQAVVIPEDQGLIQGNLFDRPESDNAPCDNGGCFI